MLIAKPWGVFLMLKYSLSQDSVLIKYSILIAPRLLVARPVKATRVVEREASKT